MQQRSKPVLMQEKYMEKSVVNIDERKSELPVQMVFDNKNGTFKITATITTKQVSRSETVNEETVRQIGRQILAQMDYGMILHDDWQSTAAGTKDQIEIDFDAPVNDTPGNAKETDVTMNYGFSEDTGDVFPDTDSEGPDFNPDLDAMLSDGDPAPSTKRKRK